MPRSCSWMSRRLLFLLRRLIGCSRSFARWPHAASAWSTSRIAFPRSSRCPIASPFCAMESALRRSERPTSTRPDWSSSRSDGRSSGRPTTTISGVRHREPRSWWRSTSIGAVVTDLNFEVQPGEILGIAGVTGSGREEVAGMLFGAIPRGGTVTLDGAVLPSLRPMESLQRGMAFVPADRLNKAAFLDMALRVNLTISKLAPVYGPFGVRKKVERQQAREWLDKLDVVPKAPEARLNSLSGGQPAEGRARPRVAAGAPGARTG